MREVFGEYSEWLYQNALRDLGQEVVPGYEPLALSMMAYVAARYHIYKLFWTDQTAHSDYRPLPFSMPESYGQCVPTSCLLFEDLQQRFPDETFSLGNGRVRPRWNDFEAVSTHVWVTWHRGPLDEDIVIDATADQIGGLAPILIGTYDELANGGFIFQAYKSFNSVDELVKRFKEREPDIEQRIRYLSLAMEGLYRLILIKADDMQAGRSVDRWDRGPQPTPVDIWGIPYD